MFMLVFIALAFATQKTNPSGPANPELMALATKHAELERRAAFLNAWVRATPNVQAHASRMLIEERDGAVRVTAAPTARALTMATRVLRDGTPDAFAPNGLRDFAESLDLRVVPGLYSGVPEGLAESLTIHVNSIYPMPLDETVHCRLLWLGADGKEIQARSEPVEPLAFQGEGFRMFVRAPSSLPGEWQLVCELSLDGKSGRGVPVPVIGVDQRDELLAESEPASLHERFKLLAQYGVRPTFFAAFLDELGVLPIGSSESWGGPRLNSLEHELFRTLDENGKRIWSLGDSSATSPACIVLLMKPEDESPEAAFVGAGGRAWGSAAERNNWLVLSSDLRLRSDEGPSLLTLAAELKKLHPESELVLIARGPAFLEVQLEQLREPKWIFDRLIVSTTLAPKWRPRNLPKLKTLVVTSEAADNGGGLLETEDGPKSTWERRMTPRIATDLELPRLLSRWLAARD